MSLLELELAPPAADGDWVLLEPDAPALPDVLLEPCDWLIDGEDCPACDSCFFSVRRRRTTAMPRRPQLRLHSTSFEISFPGYRRGLPRKEEQGPCLPNYARMSISARQRRIVTARQVRQRCGDSHFHPATRCRRRAPALEVFEGLASVKAPIVVNMTHAGCAALGVLQKPLGFIVMAD